MTPAPESTEGASDPRRGGAGRLEDEPAPRIDSARVPEPGPAERGAEGLDRALSLLTSNLDLACMGRDLIELLIESLGAARGSLLMINPHTGRTRMVAGIGVPAALVGTDLKPAQRKISDWVLHEGRSLVLNGVVRDRRFDSGAGASGIESALCLPLITGGQTLGVANLARVSPSPAFTEEDRRRAERLALPLAAILNQIQEIGWARESWRTVAAPRGGEAVIPSSWSTPRYEIATCLVRSRLAHEDVVERVAHDDGSQTILVADVAGWGAEAHAAAAFLRGLFLALGQARRSPSDYARAINSELCRRDAPAALWIAHLGATGRLLSCVAGLPAPLVIAPGRGEARELTTGGPMPGALAGATFEQENAQLIPGDRLLAVTDGVPGAGNAAGESFGFERVRTVLAERRQQPVSRLAAAVCADALAFSGLLVPVDDLTALAIRYSRDE